jgi:hypothetical protein
LGAYFDDKVVIYAADLTKPLFASLTGKDKKERALDHDHEESCNTWRWMLMKFVDQIQLIEVSFIALYSY